MKIKIIDWKLFEKSNGIYFTRDINIVNDYNVYAMEIGKKHNKEVILVDHQEKEQSVIGLDEASILEIVDHHKIGNINTNNPINFRNMTVGSTNTIIYFMYKENNVKIPKEIAGLMLSGILSDTLCLQSPTTTEIDKKVVEDLSLIAGVEANS